mmetsp:Transcript_30522/g.93344  ORF Transcript_30522/g.93344 Transcript_30522/m.93344 type:complete len:235 (+) Transcript_30522:483-1187(+)
MRCALSAPRSPPTLCSSRATSSRMCPSSISPTRTGFTMRQPPCSSSSSPLGLLPTRKRHATSMALTLSALMPHGSGYSISSQRPIATPASSPSPSRCFARGRTSRSTAILLTRTCTSSRIGSFLSSISSHTSQALNSSFYHTWFASSSSARPTCRCRSSRCTSSRRSACQARRRRHAPRTPLATTTFAAAATWSPMMLATACVLAQLLASCRRTSTSAVAALRTSRRHPSPTRR